MEGYRRREVAKKRFPVEKELKKNHRREFKAELSVLKNEERRGRKGVRKCRTTKQSRALLAYTLKSM